MGRVYNAASGTRTFTLPFSRIPLLWDEMFVPSDVSHPHSPSSRHPFHVCVCVFSGPILIHTHTQSHSHTHTHLHTHTHNERSRDWEVPKRNTGYPRNESSQHDKRPNVLHECPGFKSSIGRQADCAFLGALWLGIHLFLSLSLFSLLFHLSFDISNSEINKIW